MTQTITKLDDFTLKIEWTTPYTQEVTKDQLIARISELESNKQWFLKRADECDETKVEVQALLDEAIAKGCLTRDERQKENETPVIPAEPVTP
jgi:hypothetical protein